MQRRSPFLPVCVRVAGLGLIAIAVGCGESTNPVRPTPVSPAAAATAPAATAGLDVRANADIPAQASAGHLSPSDLTNRGWTCFEPIPNRVVCSHPNQGLPPFADPPPADRPASFSFLIFDDSGRFVGTEILLRTELYKGQICESTGRPYDFVSVIGYYECVHTVGR